MGASGRRSSSPVASAGSSDGLMGFLVTVSSSGWLRDVLVFAWSPWSRVALASWGAAASVDALAVALAAVLSVDVSALFAGSSTHSCARRSSSSLSLSATARPFSRDSFACGEVRIGGVVDSTDGGDGASGLTSVSSTFWSSRGPLAGVARLTPSVLW